MGLIGKLKSIGTVGSGSGLRSRNVFQQSKSFSKLKARKSHLKKLRSDAKYHGGVRETAQDAIDETLFGEPGKRMRHLRETRKSNLKKRKAGLEHADRRSARLSTVETMHHKMPYAKSPIRNARVKWKQMDQSKKDQIVGGAALGAGALTAAKATSTILKNRSKNQEKTSSYRVVGALAIFDNNLMNKKEY